MARAAGQCTVINVSIVRDDLPLDGRSPYHGWRTGTGAGTRLLGLFPLDDSRADMLSYGRARAPPPPLYKAYARAGASHPHGRRRPNPLPFSLDDPRPRSLVLVVMITRRLAPRSVDDALLTDSGRTRAPVHIPGFHVALAKDHLSRLGPSGVISQEGDATVRLSLAQRRASCHDPRGTVIRLFEARAGPTRGRVVVPFLKVGGPGATLRHGCGGGDVGRLWIFLCSGRLDNEGQIYRREGEARWSTERRGENKNKRRKGREKKKTTS